MVYELPKLPYAYDVLEPYIDARTMEFHYLKHHQVYTDKLNLVLHKYPDLHNQPLEDLLKNLKSLPMDEADRTAFKNNGGGYINHKMFFFLMDPKKEKDEELTKRINETFESIDKFKELFNTSALNLFGSGYAWLVEDENKDLKVYSLPNQDSPYTLGHNPLICLDVWEHAYYLNYQNRRADYIKNWWNVLKLI
ncbi:MAG: superoxide dismutase [Candidatus Roizmanbacteria bacterium]|nr:MAG: superoxide dismutase [Candidatus Roizmanbacteria bacterium]